MPIQYDETNWPFVVVTIPPEVISDREFAEHLDRMSAYFERGERFGLVIDARDAQPLSADRRRQVAERLDHDIEQHGDRLIGTGVALSSAIGRGVFKVIQWMSKASHPMMSFDTVDAALEWLKTLRLRAAQARRG